MGLFGPPNVEKMKAKRDVKGLIKALGYQKNSCVRKSAVDALGQIGDARAVEPLSAALKDSDSGVQKAAAGAVGIDFDTITVQRVEHAVIDGDVEVVYRYIQQSGARVDARTDNALRLAALYGNEFVGLLLIDAGANVRVFERYETPLSYAAARPDGRGFLVRELIRRGALPDDQSARSQLLGLAVNHGNLQAAKLLLLEGIPMDEEMWFEARHLTGYKSSDGYTFVCHLEDILATLNQPDSARKELDQYDYDLHTVVSGVLASLGISTPSTDDSIDIKTRAVIEELSRVAGSKISERKQKDAALPPDRLLATLARRGDVSEVCKLLAASAYSERNLLVATSSAVQNSHANVLRVLLARKINLNRVADGRTPLEWAAQLDP